MILIAFTIVGALFWPTVDSSYIAVAESSAVGRLRQLQATLEIYKVEYKEQGYPQNLPNLTSSYPVEKAYRFVYTCHPVCPTALSPLTSSKLHPCVAPVVAREALPLPMAAGFTSQLKDVPRQYPTIFCDDLLAECHEQWLSQVNLPVPDQLHKNSQCTPIVDSIHNSGYY